MLEKTKNFKVILFDSGYVLNKPATGKWYFSEKFYELVDEKKLRKNFFRYGLAMFKAHKLIYSRHNIATEQEEFLLFRSYYSLLFKTTRYTDYDPDDLAEILAWDIVYNDNKFQFFEDVFDTLDYMKSRYKLGIVSDTWPSLERIYRKKGLREYFSCFIMSSVHNSKKHEGKLFGIALKELNVPPEEVLFVDDLDRNLKAAKKAGIVPVKMDRFNRKNMITNYPVIHNLQDLVNLLKSHSLHI